MVVQGFNDLGETTSDNLFAGEFPRVSVLLTVSNGKFKRGTILGKKEDGKYTISASAPEAILAERPPGCLPPRVRRSRYAT